ncbi:97_t:CDS:2, partial [Acaulospora morrowiae]
RNMTCSQSYDCKNKSQPDEILAKSMSKFCDKLESIVVIDSDDSDQCEEKNLKPDTLLNPSKNVESPFLCLVCGDDISIYSSKVREWHINTCLDTFENKAEAVVKTKTIEKTTTTENCIDELMNNMKKFYMYSLSHFPNELNLEDDSLDKSLSATKLEIMRDCRLKVTEMEKNFKKDILIMIKRHKDKIQNLLDERNVKIENLLKFKDKKCSSDLNFSTEKKMKDHERYRPLSVIPNRHFASQSNDIRSCLSPKQKDTLDDNESSS